MSDQALVAEMCGWRIMDRWEAWGGYSEDKWCGHLFCCGALHAMYCMCIRVLLCCAVIIFRKAR